MHTILALGNPGPDYEKTRHNAGQLIMKAVLKEWRWPDRVRSAKFGGEVSEGVIGDSNVRVLFPDTYMNHSGTAARKAVDQETGQLVVVYDDIDLPLGEFKLSHGRGSGGHNGLKSVIDALGTPDFLRVRVGIAPKSLFGNIIRPTGDKLANYVLGPISPREEKKLLQLAPTIGEAIVISIKEGKERAMGQFN